MKPLLKHLKVLRHRAIVDAWNRAEVEHLEREGALGEFPDRRVEEGGDRSVGGGQGDYDGHVFELALMAGIALGGGQRL